MSRAPGRIKRGPIAADVIGRNFTQVFNAAIRDRRLSRRARGLLFELLSHRNGYGVSVPALVAAGPEGREAIRSALTELERYGYLHRAQERDPKTGRLGEAVYEVTDMPEGLTLEAAAPWSGRDGEDPAPDPAPQENCMSDPSTGFRATGFRGTAGPSLKKTNHKKTSKEEKQDQLAPSARSAPDARRATAGSSAREDSSGCAATDDSGPVPGSEEGPVPGRGAAEAVPRPRKVTGSGTGARKASPFTPEVRQRIYATEALLPADLRAALAATFPYGHLPNVNRVLTAQALESRSPEQLGERAARRWISYGYERDHYDGCLRSPLGVVEELLRPTPYCPDAECEDGVNLHTGDPCKLCEARTEQRRTDRRAGRPVPAHRPPRLYRDREQCEVCDRPFPGNAPADRVCGGCRTELARATALLTDGPGPEREPVTEPPAPVPGQAVPPNREFRRYREQQAQARRAALQSPTSPF